MDPTIKSLSPEETLLHDIANAQWENQYIQEDATVKNRCYCGRFFKPLISSTSLQHYFSNIDFAKVKESVQMATRAVKRTPSSLTARERQNIITTAVGKYNELIDKIAEKRNGDGVDYDLLLITAPRIRQMTQGHESDEESLKGKEKEPRENRDEISENTQDLQPVPSVDENKEDVSQQTEQQISDLAQTSMPLAPIPAVIELANIAEELKSQVQETAQAPVTLPVELPATVTQDIEDPHHQETQSPVLDLETLLNNYPPLFTETDREEPPVLPLKQQTQKEVTTPPEFSLDSLEEYEYTPLKKEESEKELQVSQEEKTPKSSDPSISVKNAEIEKVKEDDRKVERRRSPRLRSHDKQDATIEKASQEETLVRQSRRRSSTSTRGRPSSRRGK